MRVDHVVTVALYLALTFKEPETRDVRTGHRSEHYFAYRCHVPASSHQRKPVVLPAAITSQRQMDENVVRQGEHTIEMCHDSYWPVRHHRPCMSLVKTDIQVKLIDTAVCQGLQQRLQVHADRRVLANSDGKFPEIFTKIPTMFAHRFLLAYFLP
jgi:hypothetical protein